VGALIPDGQRKAMMAEAIAQLRAQGHKDVEAPAGPQRWVRGVLRVHGREITIEVNSQQRLTRLLDLLRKVAGQRAAQGGTAAAAEGWEKFWLNEKVPALFRPNTQADRTGPGAAIPGGDAAAVRVQGRPPGL
jgi:hypothetical protein